MGVSSVVHGRRYSTSWLQKGIVPTGFGTDEKVYVYLTYQKLPDMDIHPGIFIVCKCPEAFRLHWKMWFNHAQHRQVLREVRVPIYFCEQLSLNSAYILCCYKIIVRVFLCDTLFVVWQSTLSPVIELESSRHYSEWDIHYSSGRPGPTYS